jgi:hypothetical protein
MGKGEMSKTLETNMKKMCSELETENILCSELHFPIDNLLLISYRTTFIE